MEEFRWTQKHTLAYAWAVYLGVVVTAWTLSGHHFGLTIFAMLALTGWLVSWWLGAIIDASVSVLWGLHGFVKLQLDAGDQALHAAVTAYLVGLLFLAVGRLGKRSWQGKQAQEENVESVRRLEAERAFHTRFLNMAAHELGTPLTPLLIQTRVLLEKTRPEDRAAVQRLERNLQRLARLTQDLLDAGRIGEGALPLNIEAVDVTEIIRDVVADCRSDATGKRVTVDVDCPPRLVVQADRDRVAQIVWNLLRNALKFTPSGGAVRIRVADGQGVRLEVTDTGLGMTPQQLDGLFQPFTQYHRDQVNEGVGLGLHICQGIAQAHGGHLSGHSDGPGRGSTISLVLPARTTETGARVPNG